MGTAPSPLPLPQGEREFVTGAPTQQNLKYPPARPALDRAARRPDLPGRNGQCIAGQNSVERVVACFALLLTAAAPEPPAGIVLRVPPEQAMAILGHTVTDPDGKNIGRLVDVLVGAEGEPQAAVIDFGGFMGVGSRKIAVQWSALHFAP